MSNFADLEFHSDFFYGEPVDTDYDGEPPLSHVMTSKEVVALNLRSLSQGISLEPPF